MQTYLAEKYLSGPKAEAILARAGVAKKKKKRKAGEGAVDYSYKIRDDDGGWGAVGGGGGAEPDEEGDVLVVSDRSFKKRKAGEGWETVRPAVNAVIPEEPIPVDEQPVVVQTEQVPMGGLLTVDQIKKKFGSKEAQKVEKTELTEETVYRDSSGRKIDPKVARAEAARLKREQEEKEARKMEWGKGLVQREEEERRRAELEKEKARDVARYADDKDLNEELKLRERWNDPAATFLTQKSSKGPRRPTYNGPPPPPNRFGIKPGYRWDGVDRSNGFEKKFFQSFNSKRRTTSEAHAWSVEDM